MENAAMESAVTESAIMKNTAVESTAVDSAAMESAILNLFFSPLYEHLSCIHYYYNKTFLSCPKDGYPASVYIKGTHAMTSPIRILQ